MIKSTLKSISLDITYKLLSNDMFRLFFLNNVMENMNDISCQAEIKNSKLKETIFLRN